MSSIRKRRRREARAREASRTTPSRVLFAAKPLEAYVDPTLGLAYWIAGEPHLTLPETGIMTHWIAGGWR